MTEPEPAVRSMLSRAFHQARAIEANEVIGRLRDERRERYADAMSYEIALPAKDSARYLVERVMPRLVYFLDCHGWRPPKVPQMFASIFFGDRVYFLELEALFDALSSLTQLSPGDMVQRHGEQTKHAPR